MSMMKAETTITEALNYVLKEGYSRYPIYEQSKDEIVGVVHSKDIVSVYIQNNNKGLRDIMRAVQFIPETKPIDVLLRDFQRTKAQMAFVVSEFGGIIGLVTLEDILEELVGEIQDEHDHEQQIVVPTDKQTFQIAAQSSLHDINKLLDVPFPEAEEYETLAGITFL
jgi:CBS domain containing-hemolysin-like protein